MCTCIVCKSKIEPIFSLGVQPLANKYPKNSEEKKNEFKERMDIYFCETCGYANVPCNVERSVFFEDYYYLSSINKELNKHFDDLAEDIVLKGMNFVVDIGSNDGILLRPLKARGIKALGVDPSENVSKIANENGLETIVGFFDENIVSKIIQEYGRPDLITASSVFTHLEDPLSFFLNVKKLLHPSGKLIIEVEYLENIVKDFAFERFYFDRPHYYSLTSLAKLGEKNGFFVEDARIVNVHGGSLRVTFAQGSIDSSNTQLVAIYERESVHLNSETIREKFDNFRAACQEMRGAISKLRSAGISVAGYGCPARFSTITNYIGLTSDDLPFVVDDSPLKQGRYSPGMHIPIVPYGTQEKPNLYIVFAFEYISSIRKRVGLLSHGYFKPVPFIEI